MATLNSGTEIYNNNNGITYELENSKFHTEQTPDVRINKLVKGVWDNQYDGGWDEKKAKEKLFEKRTGMTKSHYRHLYGDYQTQKASK